MTAPAPTPTEFSVFLPFGKVDAQPDGTLMVHTILNDETVDDQGEIVTFDAVQKASPAYMEWANVREMHGAETAAGTMVSLTPNAEARTHEAILHVVDPIAVQKVSSGVYKGSSLGGYKRRISLSKSASGEPVRRVTEIDWRETSLVDRPSRPTARLTLLKRSDGGDPPPLVEEDLMDETPAVAAAEAPTDAPLAKVTVTTAPAPATATGTAPEAGSDVYLGPDGKPLAKAADAPPEAIDDPAPELLAKAATDDLLSASAIILQLGELIAQEAKEGEDDQVAPLREALALVQKFAGMEAAEIGTPEDVAKEAAEEAAEAMPPMAYASQTGDLGKITGIRPIIDGLVPVESAPDSLTRLIGSIVEEALAKRAAPIAKPTPPEEPPIVDDILAKTTSLLDERFARYVSRPELEAMKGEILGALRPVSEDLAKIARFPAPGGPLRFAVDGARFDDESDSPTEAGVLAKAAQSASDPHMREELGRMAAAAQIAADRKRQT